MDSGLQFQIPDEYLYELIEDEVIILNMQTGSYASLRDSAALIWSLASRGLSVSQIVSETSTRYDASAADVSADVTRFLGQLEAAGMVKRVERSSNAVALELPSSARGQYAPPECELFTDVQDLLTIDPIHDVDEMGWPLPKQAVEAAA